MTDAEKYRRNAEACEQMARKTTSLVDKEAFLKIAEQWRLLAQRADGRGGRRDS